MQDIKAIKKQAREYYSKGRFQTALNMLFRLKKQTPDDPEILNDIGTILYSMGKKKESFDFFLSAMKLDPDHNEIRGNLKGIIQDPCISNAEKKCAKELLDKSINYQSLFNKSQDPRELLRLAEIKRNSGDLAGARELCFKVLGYDSEYNEAQHLCARILHQMGDKKNAYILAEKTTKGKPVTGKPLSDYYYTLDFMAKSLGQKELNNDFKVKAKILEQFESYAKKAVCAAKLMSEGSVGKLEIYKIIEESQEQLDKSGWGNIAYYLLTHALLANGVIENRKIDKELDTALKNKNWSEKNALYHYWFDGMEIRRKVDKPKVSIVVISYRYHPKTKKCFKKLRDQMDNWGEIIFVNNGAPDEDFSSLMPYVDTYIKLKANAGVSLPRNIGAIFSSAPLLMFIEDDGIPAADLIKNHMQVHEQYMTVAARGVYLSTNNLYYPSHYYLGKNLKPAMCNQEGNSSYSANIFFKIKGFGDSIYFGSEGRELDYRLIKAGYEHSQHLYIPDAILFHDFYREKEHMSIRWLKTRASWILLHAMYPKEFEEYQNTWWMIDKGMIKVNPIKR